MTDAEISKKLAYEEKITKLFVGKVVEYPSLLGKALFAHVVGFTWRETWPGKTGIVVNAYGEEMVLSLDEIRL